MAKQCLNPIFLICFISYSLFWLDGGNSLKKIKKGLTNCNLPIQKSKTACNNIFGVKTKTRAGNRRRKHCENRNMLPREHLIGCQGVKMFLLKDHFIGFFFFSFLYKFRFVIFRVLSQLEFLSFVIIWVFEFFHNLSFWVLSHFEFLFFTFKVLSQLVFF